MRSCLNCRGHRVRTVPAWWRASAERRTDASSRGSACGSPGARAGLTRRKRRATRNRYSNCRSTSPLNKAQHSASPARRRGARSCSAATQRPAKPCSCMVRPVASGSRPCSLQRRQACACSRPEAPTRGGRCSQGSAPMRFLTTARPATRRRSVRPRTATARISSSKCWPM